MIVKKGDLFFADLSPVVGSEQGGIRPVLVVQNDVGNKYSPDHYSGSNNLSVESKASDPCKPGSRRRRTSAKTQSF